MHILAILFSFVSLHAQIANLKDVDFRKADSVAALYPSFPLKDLRTLARKLTLPLSSDVEKFRALYSWICNNIENDYEYYVTNKLKREKLYNKPEALAKWNKKFSVLVFNQLLNEQKTVCSGYAYLLKELAFHAELSCVIVDGYGRTSEANVGGPGIPNHSWNAIQLNDKWYLCDATWSSGAVDTQKSSFVKKFDDAYFLADPSLFIRNHYPLDSTWMLLQDKPSLQDFLNGPLIYTSIYPYHITELFPSTFNISATKNKAVSFRFKKGNNMVVRKVTLQINGSTISPKVHSAPDGQYVIDHVFTSRGKYIVHILLDSKYVFTYTVNVHAGRTSDTSL